MAKAKSRERNMAERSVTKVHRYQKVFAGPDGRAVLYDLISSSGMLTSNHDANPNMALMREGQRNMVLRILAMMETDANQLLERIKEHADEME